MPLIFFLLAIATVGLTFVTSIWGGFGAAGLALKQFLLMDFFGGLKPGLRETIYKELNYKISRGIRRKF